MSGYAAIILAAGRSSRFLDAPSKLTAQLQGEPMVRRVAQAALASGAAPVIVVMGHARECVAAALGGLDLKFVHNGDFAEGLAASLRCGIDAAPASAAGALILLGDMPLITPQTLQALMRAAEAAPDCAAVVPVFEGRRGNPALLKRALFPAVRALAGDCGAGPLLRRARGVVELAVEDSGVARDIDTLEDLVAAAS